MNKYLLDPGHLVWNLDQRTAHHAFEELDDDSRAVMLSVYTSKDLEDLSSGINSLFLLYQGAFNWLLGNLFCYWLTFRDEFRMEEVCGML